MTIFINHAKCATKIPPYAQSFSDFPPEKAKIYQHVYRTFLPLPFTTYEA